MLKVLLPFASTFIYIYVNMFLHTFLFRLIFHLQGFSSFAEWSGGDMKQSTHTLPATFLHKTIQPPPLHILLLILLFNLQCLLFFYLPWCFFFSICFVYCLCIKTIQIPSQLAVNQILILRASRFKLRGENSSFVSLQSYLNILTNPQRRLCK